MRRDAFDHTAPLRLCLRRTLDVRAAHGAHNKHRMLLLPKERVLRLDRVSDIGANLPDDDPADYHGLVCRDVPAAFTVAYVMILLENVTATL